MPRAPEAVDERGRHGRPWKRAKARVYATQNTCCLCGTVVDKTLQWPHPMSKSVEHKTALSLGGKPLDPNNLGIAHLRCNQSRGNGQSRRERTSEDW
jgi:5-methylcytosine-specific restriction endonuclease McrA